MAKRSDGPRAHSWADLALERKVSELTLLASAIERPAYFPSDLQAFCDWTDPEKKLLRFTRPILYKPHNEWLRMQAQQQMKACQARWESSALVDPSELEELKSLLKVVTSRYHEERKLRKDRDLEVLSLRASVDSLSAKLRDRTGRSGIRLVQPIAPAEGPPC